MVSDSIINCCLVGTTEKKRETFGKRNCVCVCVGVSFREGAVVAAVAAGSGLTLHFCCVSGSGEREDV